MRSKSKSRSDSGLYVVAGASLLLTTLEVVRRAVRHSRVFEPSREPVRTWDPADYGIPPGAAEEIYFDTPDGQRLHGWYCRAESPVASALYCHGNKGNITLFAPTVPHFLRSGINTLIFDYRGYGKSTGYPTPSGLIVDAIMAARFHDQIRPQHLPSISYGFSLGGPMAAEAARRVQFDALILQSTFTSVREMARLVFPPVPLHLLAGNPFDTLRAVEELDLPTLVIHGANDEVCPSWMGETLFRACRGAKEIHIIEGALHSNVHEIAAERVSEAVLKFIGQLPPRSERTTGDVDFDTTLTQRTLRAVRARIRRPGHV